MNLLISPLRHLFGLHSAVASSFSLERFQLVDVFLRSPWLPPTFLLSVAPLVLSELESEGRALLPFPYELLPLPWLTSVGVPQYEKHVQNTDNDQKQKDSQQGKETKPTQNNKRQHQKRTQEDDTKKRNRRNEQQLGLQAQEIEG